MIQEDGVVLKDTDNIFVVLNIIWIMLRFNNRYLWR